jgi:5'-nucleotidase
MPHSSNTSDSTPLRLLITNDDGVHAPGIFALQHALRAAGHHVTVVAPDKPRSASGHGITMHKPLRINQVKLADDSIAYAISGTPADCAILGIHEVCKNQVDFVVSGINYGANLGWDVLYSGTVAAAQEATIQGVPALALSVVHPEGHTHWETASAFAVKLVAQTAKHGLPPFTLLNANIPNLEASQIKGTKICRQGSRFYEEPVARRTDPQGKEYFWMGGRLAQDTTIEGTDTNATENGYIAVTPIHLDRTQYTLLEDLQGWDF